VTDNTGCMAQASFTITQPTAMSGVVGSINANCELPDGSASVVMAGGTPNYTYSWVNSSFSPAGNTATVTVPAGEYTVTVEDVNGCIYTNSVIVNDNPPGAVTTLATMEDCFGS